MPIDTSRYHVVIEHSSLKSRHYSLVGDTYLVLVVSYLFHSEDSVLPLALWLTGLEYHPQLCTNPAAVDSQNLPNTGWPVLHTFLVGKMSG